MGSNEAKLDWCQLEIDMLCRQHDAIYQGAMSNVFNWFAELEVGSGIKR